MKSLRGLIILAFCGTLFGLTAADSRAQSYPAKPIRIIVAFPAGGTSDILARLMAPKLTENLGQQVVIDNRGGAGGNIGYALAAQAAPDGYTILFGSAPLTINVSLYRKLAFDPLKDFTAVTLLSRTPNILAVHPSLPVKSVKELIALAKSRPGQINYASGGSGTTHHLTAELLKTMAKIDLVHVPYKGAGQGIIAVLSGEASLIIAPALSVLPHVRSGKLRALAITSVQRAVALPDLPTVAESGLPGYEASQWFGLLVPVGTPEGIVTRLNSESVKIMQTPEMNARLVAEASIPVGGTPQQFATFLRDEIVKWEKVVKFSGARVD